MHRTQCSFALRTNGKAEVVDIADSCEGYGGKKVDLSIYDSLSNYKGSIRFQHILPAAPLQVGQWIYSGHILGACHPQIPNHACYVNSASAHTHFQVLGGAISWPPAMCGMYAPVTDGVTAIVTFT
jgi:hypothetical protein